MNKASKATTPDTQTATFDYDDLKVTWEHRSWGDPADPKYPGVRPSTATKAR